MWEIFYSSNFVHQFLLERYKRAGREDAERKSYDNCYPFMYYLQHGKKFYDNAHEAPLSIKPVLLFYGNVQLLKACLLTIQADYPESSSVLAHGVSTRKRKKQNYDFFKDEVKIQKYGLFTYFSEKMFHVKHAYGEKFCMRGLLEHVEELQPLFQLYFKHKAERDKHHIHKVSAHYLLLYNLSMICRYETEWWYDLLQSYSNDAYPFIVQFLEATERKIPSFLYHYLLHNEKDQD
ncbi:YaaC-like Protein [Anoxybacillus pushchinoensis]|uniref:YaaC-like Protein n=1 Tax=Anoxybacillus pushchinoensis TaxID=150248 RepID=A0A1I0TYA2_9BACL|nr:YaaC family protein [Anoxybacillus pushchinoensis]SFA56617.1 YaaC-like Protein [Anoxybacillus pushchinoensis]